MAWRRKEKQRTYEAGERQFEEEKIGGTLVATDFAQSNGAWFVTARFAGLGLG